MIDPVCLLHGLKLSEHTCLFCCLCFGPLPEDATEDVCKSCLEKEKRHE